MVVFVITSTTACYTILLNSLLYNFMDRFVLSLFSLCNCSLICFRADGLSSLHLKYALLLETDRGFHDVIRCEITFPLWHVPHINSSCSQCHPVGGSVPPAPSKSIYDCVTLLKTYSFISSIIVSEMHYVLLDWFESQRD